jgi:phosphoenolpyruvate carboxylase
MGAVKVNNEKIWNEYVKTGKVKGFSIEGYFADKMERPKESIKEDMSEQNADLLLSQIEKIVKGEKVELGAIDDLEKKYNKLQNSAKPHMDKAYSEATKISKIATELLDVSQKADKLLKQAKELGADKAINTLEQLKKKSEVKEKYYSAIAKGISKASNK